MRRAKVLRAFDYVSTVSGGGYIGGWWSAWLSRDSAGGGGRTRYPFLNDSDVAEPAYFAARLLRDQTQETAPLSEFLRGQCSPAAVKLFRDAAERDAADAQLSKVLSSQINAVLTRCSGERADLLERVSAAAQPGAAWDTGFLSREAAETGKRRAWLRSQGATSRGWSCCALHPDSVREFAYVEGVATPTPSPAPPATPSPTPLTHQQAWEKRATSEVWWERAYYAALPPAMLLLLLVIVVSIWMLGNTSGKQRDGKLGAAVVWLMILCAAALFYPRLWTWLRDDPGGTLRKEGAPPFGFVHPHLQVLVPLLTLLGGALWVYIKRSPRDAAVTDTQGHLDLLRNRAVRVQTALLVGLAVTAFVLFFAGFGHELRSTSSRGRPRRTAGPTAASPGSSGSSSRSGRPWPAPSRPSPSRSSPPSRRARWAGASSGPRTRPRSTRASPSRWRRP
jgi:hypothetical protein